MDSGQTTLPIDASGNNVLHVASAKGDLQAVQNLLEGLSPDAINAQNYTGETALFFAAANGHLEIVKLLIAGSNLNLPNQHDATPLFMAAREGHYEIAQILLENGADPSLSNKHAVTPQDIANHNNHKKLALLIASYANKKIYKRSEDVLSKILKKGAKSS